MRRVVWRNEGVWICGGADGLMEGGDEVDGCMAFVKDHERRVLRFHSREELNEERYAL
jgi:hypothetical protein